MESLESLRKQRDEIAARIAELEQSERKTAMEQIEKLMEAASIKPEEVVARISGRKSRTKASPAYPARYRNPERPEETWCGRGHRPRWVADALASGKALEDLAIVGDGGASGGDGIEAVQGAGSGRGT